MAATDWLAAPPPRAELARGPMPARIGNVRVGTASWTERTLLSSRAFYPPSANTAERRLRYYARHFPVVEIDATYYALPSRANAELWAERTPADFAFGVKAYAALTQHPIEPARLDRELQRELARDVATKRSVYPRDLPPAVVDELWRRFHAALEPLRIAGKLSYVLFQMPKWFAPTRASHAFLEEIAPRLPGARIGVEFRQAGWMTEERRARTLDLLRRHGLVYVVVDEPQGTRASVPPVVAATVEELAVVRFHGRKTVTWDRPGVGTTERFGYLYRPDELAEWVPRIHELARRTRGVHVLMNNCHRDSAVQNAKDLAGLLASAPA
ncbi:MAG TPA: DUF72 domain-containing protein [Candidatus Binatia bacterium]|nr:DUF72 domain-containing protein [Candidatus Binatia bacterium]